MHQLISQKILDLASYSAFVTSESYLPGRRLIDLPTDELASIDPSMGRDDDLSLWGFGSVDFGSVWSKFGVVEEIGRDKMVKKEDLDMEERFLRGAVSLFMYIFQAS